MEEANIASFFYSIALLYVQKRLAFFYFFDINMITQLKRKIMSQSTMSELTEDTIDLLKYKIGLI